MNKDNLFSQIFGKVAKLNFFKPLQELINSFYVKLFKIDMSEFKPANEYKNLNELFTRKLIKPREFDAADEIFISPVDGTCLSFGTTKGLEAFSIKAIDLAKPFYRHTVKLAWDIDRFFYRNVARCMIVVVVFWAKIDVGKVKLALKLTLP